MAEGVEIVEAAERAGTTLRVNFHRAHDPAYHEIRARRGDVSRKFVARYGGGLFNYSLHIVNFFLDWFGPVEGVQSLGQTPAGEDPMLTYCCIMHAGFEAVLIGIDGLKYDQFECDLLFDDERIETRQWRRREAPTSGACPISITPATCSYGKTRP